MITCVENAIRNHQINELQGQSAELLDSLMLEEETRINVIEWHHAFRNHYSFGELLLALGDIKKYVSIKGKTIIKMIW